MFHHQRCREFTLWSAATIYQRRHAGFAGCRARPRACASGRRPEGEGPAAGTCACKPRAASGERRAASREWNRNGTGVVAAPSCADSAGAMPFAEKQADERTDELQPPQFTRTVLAAQAAGRPVAGHVGRRGLGNAFLALGCRCFRGHRNLHVAFVRVPRRPWNIRGPGRLDSARRLLGRQRDSDLCDAMVLREQMKNPPRSAPERVSPGHGCAHGLILSQDAGRKQALGQLHSSLCNHMQALKPIRRQPGR